MPQVSTFRISNSLFGIDILHIKEISKISSITPVPEAPPHIIGLMNLRGQIVSIIQPIRLWERETPPTAGENLQECRLLILKTDEQIKSLIEQSIISPISMGQDYLGYIIDEVGNVLQYSVEDLAEPPPHLKIRDMVQGILKLETEVVTVFDTAKLVSCTVRNEDQYIEQLGGNQ